MKTGTSVSEQMSSPAESLLSIDIPSTAEGQNRAPKMSALNNVAVAEDLGLDEFTISSPVPHSLHDASLSGNGWPGAAPTRFAKSLTAKDVYNLALDPSLVPRPLTIRKQTRNVSAPATLQNCTDGTEQTECLDEKRAESGKLACHFRDRPRAHQHAILDVIARIVATGVDASGIANDMDMELNELTQHLASFGVSARDTPCVVDEEVQSFYVSVPGSAFNEDEFSKAILDHNEMYERTALMKENAGKWNARSHKGAEGNDDRHEWEGCLSWIQAQQGVSQDNSCVVKDRQVPVADIDYGEVYHDAQESQDETTGGESDMKLSNSHSTTFIAQIPTIQERRLHPVIISVVIPPLEVITKPATAVPRAPRPYTSRLKSFFSKILNLAWMILSVMVGRFLGILLSELEEIMHWRESSAIPRFNAPWSKTFPQSH